MSGKILVVGPSQTIDVRLSNADGNWSLKGALVEELKHLQSMQVEIIGVERDNGLLVGSYRIVDIGGGRQPLVGKLIAVGDGAVALDDGHGDPIPLSAPPRSKTRMLRKVGAKAWVHGKRLVSGQVRVLRYGILREPAKRQKHKATTPDETSGSKKEKSP